MVAPVSHPMPPHGYGPWERVTHDLTESLVALGADVTLFAPIGSSTSARLVPTVPGPISALDLDPRLLEEEHISMAMEAAVDEGLDVVHSHLHVHGLLFSRLVPFPVVTTLHGAAWNTQHHSLLIRYAEQPFVSLSDKEREFLPELNYVATVPNGIRTEQIAPGDGGGGYLAFVGRLAPEKAPDLAIEVARRSGARLRIAGRIEERHREFASGLLAKTGDGIEYAGELDRAQVVDLLGGATALLMPLRWDEPFGLVVAESLATGTPVIAWRRGAMPEILDDGRTGFLVEDVEAAAAAVARVGELDRGLCRSVAVGRFDAKVMAAAYLTIYEKLVSPSRPRSRRPGRPRP